MAKKSAMEKTYRNALRYSQRTNKPAYVIVTYTGYHIVDEPQSFQGYIKVSQESIERYIYNPRESKHELAWTVNSIEDLQF